MKLLALLFMLLSVFSSTQANETFDLESDTSYKIGAGFISRELDDSSDKIDSTGADLSIGLVFPINGQFTTDSALHLNYLSVDIDDLSAPSVNVTDSYMIDIGFTQRLAYTTALSSLLFRPYLELGVGYGNFHTDMIINSSGTFIDTEVDVNYLKFGGSLGAELILANGFTFFGQYDFYKYNLDDEAEIAASANGVTVSQSLDLGSDSDFEGQGFTLGLAYLF